jgi:hypothetical protein
MRKIAAKAFLLADLTDGGKPHVWGRDISNTYPSEYVLLAAKDIEFDVEKTDDELTQAQIEGLQDAKRQLLAETQMKAAQIDAKIQSLLAITHEA